MTIPIPGVSEVLPMSLQTPTLAFSPDGSKFAMAMGRGRVSVWDIRSKVPLKTFGVEGRSVRYLQFSSGQSGKEALVFVEVRLMFTL